MQQASTPPARKHLPTRAEYRRFITVPTRWSDNDAFGHLNNAIYYSLFDTTVIRCLAEAGLEGERMFFVAETGCRYLAEAGFPDILNVGLRIGHLGTSSVRYELGVFREGQETAVAEGLFVHVHIDPHTRRPTPLDAEARRILEEIAS